MAYENEPPHSHWEVEGFERFELRARASGTEVRRSRKVGFCPADVYRVVMPAPVELAHLAPNPVFEAHIESECGTGNPAATRVMSGVSVGYADVYQAYLQGQYVDVTGLSAGTYRLINEANPARTILEERYDGDVAGIDVALAWPGGPERPPTIVLGASCLGRAACGA